MSMGRGCPWSCDGVRLAAGCLHRQREADYRAGSLGPGCGCKKLPMRLSCQGGGAGCPGDWAGKWAGFVGTNAEKKI